MSKGRSAPGHVAPITYPHWCADGHIRIGHASENELCPLCAVINQRDAIAASYDQARAFNDRASARIRELEADNEWLREGLRGIARMDPKTAADRMVLWANDTLSGRASDLPQSETFVKPPSDAQVLPGRLGHAEWCPAENNMSPPRTVAFDRSQLCVHRIYRTLCPECSPLR